MRRAQGFQVAARIEHVYEQITSIVNSMNAIVYVSDIETHELLFLNPYAEQLFGPNAVGRRCYEVLQKGQTKQCAFCTNHRLVVNGQATAPVVWEFQNTVTRRWFQCIDRAIRWWDGRLVRMEVAFDITDRKEADRFREQYIGLVSHDLRSPLNGILLEAQALKRSARSDPAGLDEIIASAKRMNTLIEDLLETTRLESGKIELHVEPIDLVTWVKDVVHRTTTAALRERVAVHTDDPVRALGDRNRLERVVENLLSNALKYSGSAPVEVAVRRDKAEAIVSVTDDGKGIAPSDLPHVFERFFRGAHEAADKGLGLGLYNARLIIEAHGGRIWAQNPPERGAEFSFALPLV